NDDFEKAVAAVGIGAPDLHRLQHAEEPERLPLVACQLVPHRCAVCGCVRHRLLQFVCLTTIVITTIWHRLTPRSNAPGFTETRPGSRPPVRAAIGGRRASSDRGDPAPLSETASPRRRGRGAPAVPSP